MIHPRKCQCKTCFAVWKHEEFEVVHEHGDIELKSTDTSGRIHPMTVRVSRTLRVLLEQAEGAAELWRRAQMESAGIAAEPQTMRSSIGAH